MLAARTMCLVDPDFPSLKRSKIEVQQNKHGYWRARLEIEAKEKPLEGWTGFVYASEEQARERMRNYANKYGILVIQ